MVTDTYNLCISIHFILQMQRTAIRFIFSRFLRANVWFVCSFVLRAAIQFHAWIWLYIVFLWQKTISRYSHGQTPSNHYKNRHRKRTEQKRRVHTACFTHTLCLCLQSMCNAIVIILISNRCDFFFHWIFFATCNSRTNTQKIKRNKRRQILHIKWNVKTFFCDFWSHHSSISL